MIACLLNHVGRTVALLLGSIALFALTGCAVTTPTPTAAVVSSPTAGISGSTVPVPATATTIVQTPQIQPTIAPLPTTAPPPTAVPVFITIDTPPPGTLVGSPVVLSGRTSTFPADARLAYRITSASGQQIGGGSLPVSGSPGQPGSFTASLSFALPSAGGTIRAELFENSRGPGTGGVIDLFVAPPQAITITSPPPNTTVGSPMVVTGQLARLPFQGNLAYRFVNAQGQSLGEGILPANGDPGRPSSFNASLPFNVPVAGGTIRLELYDQDAASGATAASAVLPLQVAPQPQRIIFASPPAGTFVGSPVVITGRTVRYPAQGTLGYRIIDSNGAQIGNGAFPVTGAPGQGSQFNASLNFNPPFQGGTVRIDVLDQNATTGVIIASASLNVQVVAAQQTIIIESPPNGTQVGSPVVITGRTTRYPTNGALTYRIVDSTGRVLGTGSFLVSGPIGQPTRFNASVPFDAPATSGIIRFDIFDQDQGTGAVVASASVDLRVEIAPPVPRQIIIDSPQQNAILGSPIVINGRTTRYPNGGRLNYTIRDERSSPSVGVFDVVGNPADPAAFTLTLGDDILGGLSGLVTIIIFEADPTTGDVVASATLQVRLVTPR